MEEDWKNVRFDEKGRALFLYSNEHSTSFVPFMFFIASITTEARVDKHDCDHKSRK